MADNICNNFKAAAIQQQEDDRAYAILRRMQNPDIDNMAPQIPEPVHHEPVHHEPAPVIPAPIPPAPVQEVIPAAAPVRREPVRIPKMPKTKVTLNYSTGNKGVAGGIAKFSVMMEVESITTDSDTIAVSLPPDVELIVKPPALEALELVVETPAPYDETFVYTVMMGGTVKMNSTRFIFFIRVIDDNGETSRS